MPDGAYKIQICRNAREVILETEVQVKNTKRPRQKYTANTCMGELFADPKAQQILGQMMGNNEQAKEMEEKFAGRGSQPGDAGGDDAGHAASSAYQLRAGHDVGSSGSDT